VPLWAGAALLGTVYGAGWLDGARVPSLGGAAAEASTPDQGAIRARFGFCHTGGGTNCVVDGDTIWLGGQKIRVADIDAPETHEPRCAQEQALGDRATRRLQALLNAGAVSLQAIDRDEDKYGRKLRIVLVDGASVGERLVDEGLARRYAGGRRPWC
jgi:endonuclease YncB( thermonuclease family)